jgi:hypothetical protein|tara:strand:+ start:6159 stop:6359 length:201 start_codon:yes stop_codon:yes gene_type:complete
MEHGLKELIRFLLPPIALVSHMLKISQQLLHPVLACTLARVKASLTGMFLVIPWGSHSALLAVSFA